MKQINGLSGAVLKHVALITMVFDHVNKVVIFPLFITENPSMLAVIISEVFGVLGRFAFPLFCFLLVEGFCHTRSRVRYLRNLLFFAAVSEIPFDLFVGGEFFVVWQQNVFFTLAIGFAVIWLLDVFKEKTKYWGLLAVPTVIAGCLVAMVAETDYSFYGVLVITLLYLLRSRPLVASVVAFIPLLKTPWALPAFLATNFYNGERGRQWKWFNYWFYPVHLLLLGIFRLIYNV
ncbi:MAG: conjugal transfer protein TraX [Clostridia bacterium]|nr:conjugal transfer protein TraX [Clostridia bacterium]